jgi:transposase
MPGIDRSMVRQHFKKGLPDPDATPRNGRPPILGAEQHQELIHVICKRYAERRPMPLSEVDYHVRTRSHVSMNRNAPWHVLRRGGSP